MSNKVKNAIILAAGLGQRLTPITINTPKPLIRVNGVPIIDRVISKLNKLNLEKIIIVVGYLKNSFQYLPKKYKNVILVYNEDYSSSNNISSVYHARQYLENSIIIEGDLLLINDDILKGTFNNTHYLAIKTNKTSDWCFDLDDNNHIYSFKKGGSDCFQMVGISYWDKYDGEKLRNYIEYAFSKKKLLDIYWDQVPLEYFKQKFEVSIELCTHSDVIEIDTFDELVHIDKSYTIY